MKQAVSLIVIALLLLGCSRDKKKTGTKATPAFPAPAVSAPAVSAPAVSSQSNEKTGIESALSGTAETQRVAKPVVSPEKSTAMSSGEGAPAPVIPGKGTAAPVAARPSLTLPAHRLNPDSEAGREMVKVQELLKQGKQDEAIEVLRSAINSPILEGGRPVYVRTLAALLLASGRVEQAQTLCVEYATNEKLDLFCGPLITRFLIDKQGDAAAAVAWTERLAALPLKEYASELNSADYLVALSAAGRMDQVVQNVPGLVTVTNGEKISLVATLGMIKNSDLDGAERFLAAVEAAAGDSAPYAKTMKIVRVVLEDARDKKAAATQGE